MSDKATSKVTIEDLRPMLGQLNYQLRRMDKKISVHIQGETGTVMDVEVSDGSDWVFTCDSCGKEYKSLDKVPACPVCGTVEIGDGT
jgi:rRNA maturation endonuclease Nob1